MYKALMLCIIVLLFNICNFNISKAENDKWQNVFIGDNGTNYLIDTESTKCEGKTCTFWYKIEVNPGTDYLIGTLKVNHIKYRSIIDLSQETACIADAYYFGDQGNVIKKLNDICSSNSEPLIPDSFHYYMYKEFQAFINSLEKFEKNCYIKYGKSCKEAGLEPAMIWH